jgi:outer membrane biosynthesis protein TonB
MPILELPPNPAPLRDRKSDPAGDDPSSAAGGPASQPIKVRTGRFGELEEHELIHLLDSIDDELSKSRFRESIYISTIICLALAWFIFYGPRILFHQPDYKDFVSALKERDKQITYMELPHAAPRPPAHAVPDRATIDKLKQQPRNTPTAPSEPQQQATPPPPEQAHTAAPPVQQPQLPLPSAPKPAAPLVDAPGASPNIAQNSPGNPSQNPYRSLRNAAPDYGPAPGSTRGPLQAGADILSDTMGVDFTAYMKRLTHDIKRNWEPLIPEEVQAPLMKKGIVGIRFSILPDGSLGEPMVLETRSGDVALDKAAWYAITSEGTYPPLPKEFHGPRLELRIGFYYNLEPPH